MSKFKVGDKVRCIDHTYTWLKSDGVYTIANVNNRYVILEEYPENWFLGGRFEKVYPSLEEQLEEARIDKYNITESVNILDSKLRCVEQRIKELQQAIKERDKPKGRVGIKDSLAGVSGLVLVCANGDIKPHTPNFNTSGHVAMGNLFYDRESAKRYVHDRKQAVLRGDV